MLHHVDGCFHVNIAFKECYHHTFGNSVKSLEGSVLTNLLNRIGGICPEPMPGYPAAAAWVILTVAHCMLPAKRMAIKGLIDNDLLSLGWDQLQTFSQPSTLKPIGKCRRIRTKDDLPEICGYSGWRRDMVICQSSIQLHHLAGTDRHLHLKLCY